MYPEDVLLDESDISPAMSSEESEEWIVVSAAWRSKASYTAIICAS